MYIVLHMCTVDWSVGVTATRSFWIVNSGELYFPGGIIGASTVFWMNIVLNILDVLINH